MQNARNVHIKISTTFWKNGSCDTVCMQAVPFITKVVSSTRVSRAVCWSRFTWYILL